MKLYKEKIIKIAGNGVQGHSLTPGPPVRHSFSSGRGIREIEEWGRGLGWVHSVCKKKSHEIGTESCVLYV